MLKRILKIVLRPSLLLFIVFSSQIPRDIFCDMRLVSPSQWLASVAVWLILSLWVGQMVMAVVVHVSERRRARNLGRCWKCGYDLRATPFFCPECGERNHARERIT